MSGAQTQRAPERSISGAREGVEARRVLWNHLDLDRRGRGLHRVAAGGDDGDLVHTGLELGLEAPARGALGGFEFLPRAALLPLSL